MRTRRRLLCFGDLHLGAGTDYGREPGDRLRDQQDVLAMVVQLANENDVDAVLFAGDAFHRRRPTPAELLAFARPLVELEAPLIAIAGNHDVESADLPTALEVFTNDASHDSPGLLTLSTRPEVINLPGLAVATLPWTPVSRLIAQRDGGDRDRTHDEVAAMLVAAARGLRAEIPADTPAVLMLHWSISGASTPTGALTDEFREVVLDVDELGALGFDAVVMGHIHRHQVLCEEPWIGYVGSPLPVDFSEANTPHGCVLLELAA